MQLGDGIGDFPPLWDDRTSLAELSLTTGAGLGDLPLFCDEQALDAVVPPPSLFSAAFDILPNSACSVLDEGAVAAAAASPPQWPSLLDESNPLRRRVSVSITGKRRRDEEEQPSKRPKSTPIAGIPFHMPPASYAHNNAHTPPNTMQVTVDGGVATSPALSWDEAHWLRQSYSQVSDDTMGHVTNALKRRLDHYSSTTTSASLSTSTPCVGILRRGCTTNGVLPSVTTAVSAVQMAASSYVTKLQTPTSTTPRTPRRPLRQTLLTGRHRKPNLASRSTSLRKRDQLTSFSESFPPIPADYTPPLGAPSALQCYMLS